MTDKLQTKITYVLAGISLASLLLTFALDSRYANNPQVPDPSIGRVFARAVKSHGLVYLTPYEYEPYRWLMGLVFLCWGLIVLLYAVDFLQSIFLQKRGDKK